MMRGLLARKKGGGSEGKEDREPGEVDKQEALATTAPAGLGGLISQLATGGVMGLLRKKKAEEVVEVHREEWETWNLAEFLKEMNFRDAPAAARGKKGGTEKTLPGMSAHPSDRDVSFEELMAEYRAFEIAVEGGQAPEGGHHGEYSGQPGQPARAGLAPELAVEGEAGMGATGILKKGEKRADLLKSRGGKDPTTRVTIDAGDVDRRAQVREVRTAGATTAGGDGMSRPGTVRFGVNTASSFGEGSESNFGDTGGRGYTRGSTGGRPETGASAMSFQSAASGRLDIGVCVCKHTYAYTYMCVCVCVCVHIHIYTHTCVCVCVCVCTYIHLYTHTHTHTDPMGDALMFDQPGLFNCSKQNLVSIPMVVYSEHDFGGPCIVLWAHQNRITWLPEVFGRLTALTELRLHHNQIEVLPPEFARLRSIKKLWLNDNLLAKCPDELGELTTLETLSLSRNPFKELTTGVGRLIRLKDMMLDSLELRVPPNEIVVRGPRKIVEYMGKIREAQDACEKYRSGSGNDLNVVDPDKQMVLYRLNNDAPTQDDLTFWRQATMSPKSSL
jgi:hypothetical protein